MEQLEIQETNVSTRGRYLSWRKVMIGVASLAVVSGEVVYDFCSPETRAV